MSSSTQDEISFVLRQFLLRSSVTTHESNDDARNSMSKTALPDGISAYKGSSAANVSSLSVAASENETDDFDCESEVLLLVSNNIVHYHYSLLDFVKGLIIYIIYTLNPKVYGVGVLWKIQVVD